MANNQICWVTDIRFEGCTTQSHWYFSKAFQQDSFRTRWLLWSKFLQSTSRTSLSLFQTVDKETFWKLCLGLHHAGLFRWREPSPPDGSKMKSFENTSGSQTEPPTDETSCIIHVNKNSLLNLVEPRKFILSMCFCCQVRSIWSSSSQRIRRACSLQRESRVF